jgi:hypothetical protein
LALGGHLASSQPLESRQPTAPGTKRPTGLLGIQQVHKFLVASDRLQAGGSWAVGLCFSVTFCHWCPVVLVLFRPPSNTHPIGGMGCLRCEIVPIIASITFSVYPDEFVDVWVYPPHSQYAWINIAGPLSAQARCAPASAPSVLLCLVMQRPLLFLAVPMQAAS